MSNDKELKIIKAVCDAESRGFSITKRDLNKLSGKHKRQVALTIIEETGLFIVLCLGWSNARIMATPFMTALLVTVLIALIVRVKYVYGASFKQVKNGASSNYAVAMAFWDEKLDLKMLSEYDNDLFNIVMFSSMVLQNRDVWRLFKRNKLFKNSYADLTKRTNLTQHMVSSEEYQKACSEIKNKALSVLKQSVINVENNLKEGVNIG